MFTKECLEKLKEKISLTELLTGHIELKRAGTNYKALCPFHQEKTPSFVVQKGDSHYHCFGCGAHGDSIQFLMQFLHLSFVESVELLAEKFQVTLERVDKEDKGKESRTLKDVCSYAAQFFHFYLVYSSDAKEALHYLFQRGLTIDFIRKFQIGFVPESAELFCKVLCEKKFKREELVQAGLLNTKGHPFFQGRICFPIQNHFGQVIGFSARKFKESTFGGKYINTPETLIFKKSKIIFGLHFSKRRIAKERQAIIVEGQIDCLRLIECGLNLTVAALGTAFGEAHVQQLQKLGVRVVYILFDSDSAGIQAASKTGDLFQKIGIETKVVSLPDGMDPDGFLSTFGTEKLIEELDKAVDYLRFQMNFFAREIDLNSPAAKAGLFRKLKSQIEAWDEPVMVHESLKKMANLLSLPIEMVDTEKQFSYVKKSGSLIFTQTDPNKFLEMDLLRWLLLLGEEKPEFVTAAQVYLKESHFWTMACRNLFVNFMKAKTKDLLSIGAEIEDSTLLDEILKKRINRDRADQQFLDTVQKLLDREWMQKRESIKNAIHDGKKSEEEILLLAKSFDELQKERPKAQWITSNT